MHVGCSTLYALLEKKETAAVRELAENGFRAIEVTFEYSHFLSRRETASLKKLGREFGLSYSMHFPWTMIQLTHPWRDYRRWQSRVLRKALRASEEIEATHCVVHAGRFVPFAFKRPSRVDEERLLDYCVAELAPLARKADGAGMKLVAENCMHADAFGDARCLRYVLARVPELGFCLDIAHAEVMRQTSELRKLVPSHVHATDNRLREDEHAAVGAGKIDFVPWLRALAQKGFKGKIIIECGSLRDCISSKRVLNDLIARLG